MCPAPMTASGSRSLTDALLDRPLIKALAVFRPVGAIVGADAPENPDLQLALQELDQVAHVLVLDQPVGFDFLERLARAQRRLLALARVQQSGRAPDLANRRIRQAPAPQPLD